MYKIPRLFIFTMSLILTLSLYAQSSLSIRQDINNASIDLLNTWYPRVVDFKYGGYIPTWSFDWKNRDDNRKGIVTQARHTWSTSTAALHYPEMKILRKSADAGFEFLKNAMWDSLFGGFYEYRDRKGGAENVDDTKRMYGNAFGIYALCAYYKLTGNNDALILAQQTFQWLEDHARDPEYDGYFNQLQRDGTPMHLGDLQPRGWDVAQAGLKDYNSSIHLLEAYTSLYEIWPDSCLRERLYHIFILIRDVFVTDNGYLHLFFKTDWTPVSYQDSSEIVRRINFYTDHVSFGHDVETAYLLLEAADVLHLKPDLNFDKKIRLMVDHALANGWDNDKGGLYEAAYYYRGDSKPTIMDFRKTWWVQAEALNAFLLMADHYPDDRKYWSSFEKQWEYIQTFMVDHDHGGWYENGTDTDPKSRTRLKAHHWKTTYHNLRALLNCYKMLTSDHIIDMYLKDEKKNR